MNCHHCGAEMKEGDKVCSKCGTAMEETAKTEQTETNNGGGMNPETEKQENGENTPTAATAKPKSKKGVIFGVIAAVICVVIGIGAVGGKKSKGLMPYDEAKGKIEAAYEEVMGGFSDEGITVELGDLTKNEEGQDGFTYSIPGNSSVA